MNLQLDLGPRRLDGRHQHHQTRAARARLAPILSPPTSPATRTYGERTAGVLIAAITRDGRAGPLTRWRSRPARGRDGCTHRSVSTLALASFFVRSDHACRRNHFAAHLLAHHLLVCLTVGELAQHLQQSEQSEAGVDVREQLVWPACLARAGAVGMTSVCCARVC